MSEGSEEAIKILSEHPDDYKLIRFVPGIEFNTKHKLDEEDKPKKS